MLGLKLVHVSNRGPGLLGLLSNCNHGSPITVIHTQSCISDQGWQSGIGCASSCVWHREAMYNNLPRLYWWRNSLGPSDVTWWQRTESTLAQVMPCCLTAPSHYLNICWLIISDIHMRAISQKMPQPSITKISSKITCLKFHSNIPNFPMS